MGTRSLTFVYDDAEPVVCMYRQFDGYPTGHGAELAEFLNTTDSYNGMGCLAAQLVSYFKKEPLNFYLHAPILGRDDCQEYEYHVHNDKVLVTTPLAEEILFLGSWKQLAEFCKEKEVA
jgi:hypothetical protein